MKRYQYKKEGAYNEMITISYDGEIIHDGNTSILFLENNLLFMQLTIDQVIVKFRLTKKNHIVLAIPLIFSYVNKKPLTFSEEEFNELMDNIYFDKKLLLFDSFMFNDLVSLLAFKTSKSENYLYIDENESNYLDSMICTSDNGLDINILKDTILGCDKIELLPKKREYYTIYFDDSKETKDAIIKNDNIYFINIDDVSGIRIR